MVDVILIHGPQGSGKGTQCAVLVKKYNAVHISTGELFRKDAEVKKQIDDGTLANSNDFYRLVEAALDEVDPKTPIILDGVGRMPEETKWLDAKLQAMGRTLNVVIVLLLPEEESIKRLTGRSSEVDRGDDDLAAIKKRLAWSKEITGQSIDYWRSKGLVREIDGMGTREEVAQRIQEAIDAA